jgi:hypothetical protein
MSGKDDIRGAVSVCQRAAERIRALCGDLEEAASRLPETEAEATGVMTGIPLVREVRLPMKNLDKPWYDPAARWRPYNHHPERCQDRNLESGGDTDLCEPLVAPFDGVVLAARDYRGKIGRVVQILGLGAEGLIVWAGWHLENTLVSPGQIVSVGQPIGAIGNADGVYAAHLHEQISVGSKHGVPQPRVFPGSPRWNWVRPDDFYKAHGVDVALVERVTAFDGE